MLSAEALIACDYPACTKQTWARIGVLQPNGALDVGHVYIPEEGWKMLEDSSTLCPLHSGAATPESGCPHADTVTINAIAVYIECVNCKSFKVGRNEAWRKLL